MNRLLLVLFVLCGLLASAPPEGAAQPAPSADEFCGPASALRCPRTGAQVCHCTMQGQPTPPAAPVVLVAEVDVTSQPDTSAVLPRPADDTAVEGPAARVRTRPPRV